ncbi:MAG: hypothetical protein ACK2UO_19285 [Caldilineaceae bacterium]|jgi:hypothetical protein
MKRTILTLVAVLVLMSLFSATALAQEDGDSKVVFCGELSQADCDQLTESRTALWDLTSGETAETVSVYLQGFEQISPDMPVASVTTRSMFVADPATIDRMLELQQIDPDELAGDPDVLLEASLLPLSIDAASSTTVVFSPQVNAMLSQLFGRPIPPELVHEMRLVDGVAYINLANLAQISPRIASIGDWIGIDLMAFMPRLTETSIADGTYDIENLGDALKPPGEGVMAQPYLVMVKPGTEPIYNTFLEILPLRDASIDGEPTAVYRMRMDVPAYVRSPAFAARISTATDTIDEALANELQPSDQNIAGTILQEVSSVLVRNSDAVVTQAIGYEDAYLLAMDMQLALGIADRSVTVDIKSGNSNMDSIDSIPVPANAFVVPIRLIMGLIETFGNSR